MNKGVAPSSFAAFSWVAFSALFGLAFAGDPQERSAAPCQGRPVQGLDDRFEEGRVRLANRVEMWAESSRARDHAFEGGEFEQALGPAGHAETAGPASTKGHPGIRGRHDHIVDYDDPGVDPTGQSVRTGRASKD